MTSTYQGLALQRQRFARTLQKYHIQPIIAPHPDQCDANRSFAQLAAWTAPFHQKNRKAASAACLSHYANPVSAAAEQASCGRGDCDDELQSAAGHVIR